MSKPYVVSAFLALAIAIPSVPSAKIVRGGREYVRQKREIIKAKKHLVVEQQQIVEFEWLLAEVDAMALGENMSNFRKVNGRIRDAMDREHRAVRQRMARATIQRAATGGAHQEAQMSGFGIPVAARKVDASMSSRADRMRTIIRESGGLEHAVGAGDSDALARYRYLLGSFLELMQEEVAAIATEITEHEKRLE